MKVTLNNQTLDLPDNATVADALDHFGLPRQAAVVERNQNAVLAREFESTRLEEGDTLVVFRISAGG